MPYKGGRTAQPIIDWMNFILYGKVNWDNGEKPHFVEFPIWGIPIHVAASLIFGSAITLFLEEPVRDLLKQWRDNKNGVHLEEHKDEN